ETQWWGLAVDRWAFAAAVRQRNKSKQQVRDMERRWVQMKIGMTIGSIPSRDVNLHPLTEFPVGIICSELRKRNFSPHGDEDGEKSSSEDILGRELGK
ncbi:hypothetical protein A2U01_0050116, partial [Trifolium medium]|nr:hypothetical protein [Trifolium medium]